MRRFNPLRLPMALQALQALLSAPATRCYPLERRAPFPQARGELTFDLSTCVFCGLCERRCPCVAIAVSRETKTLAVEYLRCTSCGLCVEACTKHSLGFKAEPLAVQVHPVRHHRVEWRKVEGEPAEEHPEGPAQPGGGGAIDRSRA